MAHGRTALIPPGRAARPRVALIAVGALVAWSASAWAFPGPMLGPDGPLHVGPLPPAVGDARGVVLVDPVSGALSLSLPGAAGTFTWEGTAWLREGVLVAGPDEPDPDGPADIAGRLIRPEGRRWGWEEGRLAWVTDRQGGQVRIEADERGRPQRLAWPDGSRLEVLRDAFGRVTRTEGPGDDVLSLDWRTQGLVVTDPLGAPLRITRGPGLRNATRSVAVEDALGRVARAFYGPDADGTERLMGWEDPRGLQAWISRDERQLEVVDGAGRSWRVELDDRGQVVAVADPGGWRWSWRRDAAGRVVGLEDPAGRIHGWGRDRDGRLSGYGRGSMPWSLRWDAQGRLVELIDPVGSAVHLQRDERGRVTRITDPLGNEVLLARSSSGQVEAVTGRTGARWRVELDLLGRPARVVGPDTQRLELDRDGSGRLVALHDPVGGTFYLDRSAGGALTRLRAPSGEAVGMRRDALGRLLALRWDGGGELTLRRDAAGEVVEVSADGRTVGIQRDVNEAPLGVGAVRWKRDGAGRVVGIEAPGRSLTLRRDGAGLLSAVEAEGWWLRLLRDGAGRAVRWLGTDGEVQVRRNSAGRIVQETVTLVAPPVSADPRDPLDLPIPPAQPEEEAVDTGLPAEDPSLLGSWADEVLPPAAPPPAEDPPLPGDPVLAEPSAAPPVVVDLAWDSRGRLQRMDLGDRGWRLLRDAAGRVLRLSGPGDLALGVDRDQAGRPQLLRHPAHTLRRAGWGSDDVVLAVDDASGRRLSARLLRWDAQGRISQDEDPTWGPRVWQRDGRGRLMSVDIAGQPAWTFAPGGSTDPDGGEVVLDGEGRISSARPPVGAPAWGVGSATVSYAWGETGLLEWVAGELGAVRLVHDVLGRLVALQPEADAPWALRYDARGRLARIERGDQVEHQLTWSPAIDDGPAALLASGLDGGVTWLPGPAGPAGVSGTGGVVDLVLDLAGDPWWLVPASGPAVSRSVHLRGYPELGLADGSGADLLGPAGAIQPFVGGPLLALSQVEGGGVPAGAALDPVSGQRVDGLGPQPWQEPGWWQDGGPARLDPEPWEATGPWREPLRLLVAMGELSSPMPGDWTELPAQPSALPWLPGSLDRADPPLGPSLDALPFAEDPLTTAWLLACLPSAPPPEPGLAARVMIGEELDIPWLPPGVALPLPASVRSFFNQSLPVSGN